MKKVAVYKQGHKIKNAAGYNGDNLTPNIGMIFVMVMVLMVFVIVMVVMVTMVVMMVGDN